MDFFELYNILENEGSARPFVRTFFDGDLEKQSLIDLLRTASAHPEFRNMSEEEIVKAVYNMLYSWENVGALHVYVSDADHGQKITGIAIAAQSKPSENSDDDELSIPLILGYSTDIVKALLEKTIAWGRRQHYRPRGAFFVRTHLDDKHVLYALRDLNFGTVLQGNSVIGYYPNHSGFDPVKNKLEPFKKYHSMINPKTPEEPEMMDPPDDADWWKHGGQPPT